MGALAGKVLAFHFGHDLCCSLKEGDLYDVVILNDGKTQGDIAGAALVHARKIIDLTLLLQSCTEEQIKAATIAHTNELNP